LITFSKATPRPSRPTAQTRRREKKPVRSRVRSLALALSVL
jgi:hypothetical protein